MPRFSELDHAFTCPYRDGCPYLEGLSTAWVWRRYQQVVGTECHYEYQLEELHKQLNQERRQRKQVELEREQLKAQLHALHCRQFKGRRTTSPPCSECTSAQHKKRGPPSGHPPWQRAKPTRLDQVLATQAPTTCPHCGNTPLVPVAQVHIVPPTALNRSVTRATSSRILFDSSFFHIGALYEVPVTGSEYFCINSFSLATTSL